MKVCYNGLCVVLSISLLSSCAYMDGRKNQLEMQRVPTPPAKKAQKVAPAAAPVESSVEAAPNPSETATKMLTPMTQ